MRLFLLIFLPVIVHAQSKANFFPRLDGQVIEERLFEDKIERGLEKKGYTYRYVVNHQDLSEISFAKAIPIHMLGQYSICSMTASKVVMVYSQYEPRYVETRFKCVPPPKDFDPVKNRNKLKEKYCTPRTIFSRAQEIICKELGLK